MSTADIALIVNGVIKLAVIGTGYALGRQVMDRVRVVNPAKQQSPGAAEESVPIANLDDRRSA